MHVIGGGMGGGGGGGGGGALPPRPNGRRPSADRDRPVSQLQPSHAHAPLPSDHHQQTHAPSHTHTAVRQPQPPQHRRGASGGGSGGSGNGSNGAHSFHPSPPVVPSDRRGSREQRGSGLAGLLSASPLTIAPAAVAAAAAAPASSAQSSPVAGGDEGRRTPEPPHSSYRIPAHGFDVPPHPPSAPPAPRPQAQQARASMARRAPPSAGAAAGFGLGIPVAGGGMGAGLDRPPPALLQSHTPRLMFESKQGAMQQQQHAPPQRHSGHDHLSVGSSAAAASGSGRGSLQHTLQSARSSAYAQLTLQQPAPASSSSASRHISNSPSPNSTPVRSGGAPSYSRGFDRLHVFDSSPLASPKDLIAMAGPGAGRHGHGGLGANGSHQHQLQPSHSLHQRGVSELDRRRGPAQSGVALSWPSELMHSGGGSSVAPMQRYNSYPVRASHPLPSPPGGGGASNFPSILKRGAQLIEQAPPVLSAALAHQLQLDDYGDELDEYDEDSGTLAPPDFSAAFAADDRPHLHTHGHPSRLSKNGRIGSGARSAKKAAAGGAVGAGPLAGMKKLDVASAQAFRSPYTRKSFARVGGGAAKSKAAAAAAEQSVLPAEEWVASASDDDDHESGAPAAAPARPSSLFGLGPTGTHRQHPSSSSVGMGDDGGGGDGPDGGGSWTLDIGVAEDANPRFRASMEDAIVVKRRFGPRFWPRQAAHAAAPDRRHDHDDGDDSPHSASAASVAAASAQAAVAPICGSFFGVYDGHGGRHTVDFIAQHFHRELARKLSALGAGGAGGAAGSSAEVSAAIEATCRTVDGAMAPRETGARCYGDDFQDCGSTACVAYLRPCGKGMRGRELFFANVGDAQAVLAVDKAELQRIKQAEAAAAGDKKAKRGSSASGSGSAAAAVAAASSTRAESPPLTATLHARQVSTDRTPKKAPRDGSASGAGVRTSRANSIGLGAAPAMHREPSLAKTLTRALQSSSSSNSSAGRGVRLTALPMSYAHVATDPKEMARIKAAGGCVFANRVSGCLAVSRAFGDWSLKPAGVSSVPFQQRVRLTAAHKFLVIACDGTFDVLSHADVVDLAAQHLAQGSRAGAAQRAAQALVAEAIRRGTTDNVSVIVVAFGHTAAEG